MLEPESNTPQVFSLLQIASVFSGTDQKHESAEEGTIDEDGGVIVSKKMTRIVTTTRTYPGFALVTLENKHLCFKSALSCFQKEKRAAITVSKTQLSPRLGIVA